MVIIFDIGDSSTYDHRLVRTGHPVRSAILKHQIGRSVVGWVTTSESLLLYVFLSYFAEFIVVVADNVVSEIVVETSSEGWPSGRTILTPRHLIPDENMYHLPQILLIVFAYYVNLFRKLAIYSSLLAGFS